MTKDERFLIEVYRAHLAGQEEINPHLIAQKLGIKEIPTNEILKGLRQANFIKIYGPEEIVLTERGIELARSLL